MAYDPAMLSIVSHPIAYGSYIINSHQKLVIKRHPIAYDPAMLLAYDSYVINSHQKLVIKRHPVAHDPTMLSKGIQ